MEVIPQYFENSEQNRFCFRLTDRQTDIEPFRTGDDNYSFRFAPDWEQRRNTG